VQKPLILLEQGFIDPPPAREIRAPFFGARSLRYGRLAQR
jgi:hypothetical protein